MSKHIKAVLLAITIICCSASVAFAFGGGSRGGTFGTGGFSSSTVSTQLDYNTLNQLCTEINYGIVDGLYSNMAPFSSYPNVKFAATIGAYNTTDNPQRYVIYVTYQNTKYYFKNNSGGLYWAYLPTSDANTWKPFYDKIEAIRSQLVTANNTLTAISTKITTLTNNVSGDLTSVVSYLTSQSDKLTNIQNRLVVTRSDTGEVAITTIVNWIYNSIASMDGKLTDTNSYLSTIASRMVVSVDGTQTNITPIVKWIYDNTDGVESALSTTNTNLSNINSNLSTIASRLVVTVDGTQTNIAPIVKWIYDNTDGIESALSTIITNTGTTNTLLDSHAIWMTNLSAASSFATIEVSESVANQMVADINAGRMGNYGYFYQSPFTYSDRRMISHAFINASNEIRIMSRTAAGATSNMRLVTPDGHRYVVVPDGSSADYTDIETLLTNIYNAMFVEVQGSETRSTSLIPLPIDQMVYDLTTTTTGSIATGIATLVDPAAGVLFLLDDIIDIIDDFSSDPDYSTVLNNINSALRTTVDGTQYTVAQLSAVTAERTNDIYEWLTNADLLDDNTVVVFIDHWGSYVNNALLNGDNIMSLFYHAYLSSVPTWEDSPTSDGMRPFSEAIQYFDDILWRSNE